VQNNPKTSANLALAMLLVIVGCTANPRPGSERAIVPSPTSIDGGAGDAPGRTADDDAGQPPNLPDAGLIDAADGGAIEPPAFAQQPTSLQVTSGGQATFTAVVLRAVSYQWRKNGTAMPGATSSIYSIAATTPGDEGTYDLVATNSRASVVSTAATLTVTPAFSAPVITVQPVAITAFAGEVATLSAVAEANPAASYQWRKGGTAISGNSSANSATLNLVNVSTADAGIPADASCVAIWLLTP